MTATRSWPLNLAIGAGVGLGVGLIVGGTVGRIFMRILFVAREENSGFATAMGAIIGDFTRAGTIGIYAFAAIAGVALGLAYAIARTLLPSGTRLRVIVFTVGTTAFMLGQIVRGNRDDFAILPVTFSLILIAVSVAITAAPVPLLIERIAPDRDRNPGWVARGVVMIGMTGFALFAATGIVIAYSQQPSF